jgi:hypothetical protein
MPWSPLLGLMVLATLVLAWWRTNLVRRREQSWESLIGRLKDCHGRQLSPQFLWREGLAVGPEEMWNRLGGLRGLWSLYRNTSVMIEMAEFAARHGAVDAELLETLRCNAIQIRLCLIAVMGQCVFEHASESVRVQAFGAASVYTGMAARMAELLRKYALTELPQFVEAM